MTAAGTVSLLRDALQGHAPGDDREELSKAIMLAELDRLERPFDRDADPTHFTASAIVTGDRGVVLHRHRRLHRWLQPGGHVDLGELPADAAIRECVEETGLAVVHPPSGPALIHLDVHRSAQDHIHLDLRYLVWAPHDDPAPAPGESQDVAWFSWERATDLADDALVGALRSASRLLTDPRSLRAIREEGEET